MSAGRGSLPAFYWTYLRTTADRIRRFDSEGKTDREIRRCLKRYIARGLYRRLREPTVSP